MLSADQLVRLAQAAREMAYAPYSGYRVGAAIETDAGKTVSGCNVENVSYGATICAERTAATRMVAQGDGSKIVQLAVASDDGVPPCGICLQVLSEFIADGSVPVHMSDSSGKVVTVRFDELLPYQFKSEMVRRTR